MKLGILADTKRRLLGYGHVYFGRDMEDNLLQAQAKLTLKQCLEYLKKQRSSEYLNGTYFWIPNSVLEELRQLAGEQ